MSDSKKPKPSQPPILPRTWKAAPEPDAEPEPPVASKKTKSKAGSNDPAAKKPAKKSKKAKPSDSTDEPTGSKLEETPLLDTYEARRTVRLIVGSVMSLFGLIAIIVLVRMFQPGSPGPDVAADKKEPRTAIDSKESSEREAAVFVENAKKADKDGKTPVAIVLLQKVTRNYEGTEAAREANAALDRDRRNRPLFEVDAAKNPTGPIPPTPSKPTNVANVPGPTQPPVVAAPKPPEIVARALPNGFHADPSSKLHPSGWPFKIICERDGASMVLVPAGEFLMGRDDGDASERPSHWVRLSTYYIDEHEVTNRQYQYYLRESGRPLDIVRQTVTETPEPIAADKLDLPAVGLTAREARSYCVWANRRLPTEAQWEMAARSGDGRVSYGISKEPAKSDQGGRTLDPVMTTPSDRSPYGAFDLAGNAWEWTSDYYDPSYYNQLRGLSTDPAGPTQSRIKPPQVTVKGGSKIGVLTWREGLRIEAKLPQVGFRGVLPVELPATPPPSAQPGGPGVNPPGGVVPF